MLKYIQENKKNILIAASFLLFVIILSIIVNVFTKKSNDVLVTSYVSSLTEKDFKGLDDCDIKEVLKDSKVPYFNFKSDFYDKMNDEVMYEFLLRACYQNGIITYDASINENILSLAVNISYESVNDLTYVEYKTYNIDIKKNEVIDNASLLNKYNKSLDDANNAVMSKLLYYYDYEIKNNQRK